MLKWVNPAWTSFLIPWAIFKGNSSEIYFTFDDGPHPEYTPAVLDVLKINEIKATFFLRGTRISGNEAIVRRIADEGHVIGNHAWSHTPLWFKSNNTIRNEIETTAEAVKVITGRRTILFRPPYGRFDSRFKCILRETSHKMVLWSLLAYDWTADHPGQVMHTVKRHLHPGAIMTFHDGHACGDMLPEILIAVIALAGQAGLRFGVLS
ncbi:polysaccharide deacetylase family protein [bacterium]|nr:polysaccharide deacetylase family protein [bacterium]